LDVKAASPVSSLEQYLPSSQRVGVVEPKGQLC
jgi:hypothetical protein